MPIGYFIYRGDRTSCGGEVLEGEPTMSTYHIARAREGDRVTCGANGETYAISGGLSYFRSYGQRVAGSLDSVSGCPCRAQLIPSLRTMTYQQPESATVPTPNAPAVTATAQAQAQAPKSVAKPDGSAGFDRGR